MASPAPDGSTRRDSLTSDPDPSPPPPRLTPPISGGGAPRSATVGLRATQIRATQLFGFKSPRIPRVATPDSHPAASLRVRIPPPPAPRSVVSSAPNENTDDDLSSAVDDDSDGSSLSPQSPPPARSWFTRMLGGGGSSTAVDSSSANGAPAAAAAANPMVRQKSAEKTAKPAAAPRRMSTAPLNGPPSPTLSTTSTATTASVIRALVFNKQSAAAAAGDDNEPPALLRQDSLPARIQMIRQDTLGKAQMQKKPSRKKGIPDFGAVPDDDDDDDAAPVSPTQVNLPDFIAVSDTVRVRTPAAAARYQKPSVGADDERDADGPRARSKPSARPGIPFPMSAPAAATAAAAPPSSGPAARSSTVPTHPDYLAVSTAGGPGEDPALAPEYEVPVSLPAYVPNAPLPLASRLPVNTASPTVSAGGGLLDGASSSLAPITGPESLNGSAQMNKETALPGGAAAQSGQTGNLDDRDDFAPAAADAPASTAGSNWNTTDDSDASTTNNDSAFSQTGYTDSTAPEAKTNGLDNAVAPTGSVRNMNDEQRGAQDDDNADIASDDIAATNSDDLSSSSAPANTGGFGYWGGDAEFPTAAEYEAVDGQADDDVTDYGDQQPMDPNQVLDDDPAEDDAATAGALTPPYPPPVPPSDSDATTEPPPSPPPVAAEIHLPAFDTPETPSLTRASTTTDLDAHRADQRNDVYQLRPGFENSVRYHDASHPSLQSMHVEIVGGDDDLESLSSPPANNNIASPTTPTAAAPPPADDDDPNNATSIPYDDIAPDGHIRAALNPIFARRRDDQLRRRQPGFTPHYTLESAQDFSRELGDFISRQHLAQHYTAADPYVVGLAEQAAHIVARDDCPYDSLDLADISKVSLYTTVILVDDSGSMSEGTRVSATKEALERIVDVATTFETDGIKMRFLNSPRAKHEKHKRYGKLNGKIDGIRGPKQVLDAFTSVKFSGKTPLGRALREKVLEPMVVGPAERGELRRPVLVSIITDGEPDSRAEVVDTISDCLRRLEAAGYERSSVAFHITQVGQAFSAMTFLDELTEHDEVGAHVYRSTEDIDELAEYYRKGDLVAAYNLWWNDQFLIAIDPIREEDAPHDA